MNGKRPQPEFDTCPTCTQTKPIAEFGRSRRRAAHCLDECIACQDVCRAARDEARSARLRERRQAYRRQVLAHYGTACACCGADQELEIDHVNGGGDAHRQEVNQAHLCRWLVENDFPEGFQTLCAPCNASKKDTPQCRLSHGTLADPGAEWWTIQDVAAFYDLKVTTARTHRYHGRLPPGDRMIGRTPAWRPATIAAWKRPGRGARTDLNEPPAAV